MFRQERQFNESVGLLAAASMLSNTNNDNNDNNNGNNDGNNAAEALRQAVGAHIPPLSPLKLNTRPGRGH